MKVYTKTGDKGKTSLVGGERVSKCCERLESYGTIDELNSFVGLLITECTDDHDIAFLSQIQKNLFVVGGNLATNHTTRDIAQYITVTDAMIADIEAEIDVIDTDLEPLKAFVIPGGTKAASLAHVCRTVCRRGERAIYRLQETGTEVDESLCIYVNRLSDYFFVLSRKLNKQQN